MKKHWKLILLVAVAACGVLLVAWVVRPAKYDYAAVCEYTSFSNNKSEHIVRITGGENVVTTYGSPRVEDPIQELSRAGFELKFVENTGSVRTYYFQRRRWF